VHKPTPPHHDALPPTYAEALRLRDQAVPDDQIAQLLGIDITALPGLFTIAEAKLATLHNSSDGGAPADS
jgi:hypothetical protein